MAQELCQRRQFCRSIVNNLPAAASYFPFSPVFLFALAQRKKRDTKRR